ncbi:NAD(P)H-binding protein [Salinirubellus salinus]|uniref:NAD(P)H-binding protein n=1 Tax=Salinirubellus salinus TaxID=1364945 RepID=UPI0034A118D7
MNVLVVGGSGFVGSNLCRELVERGHEVAALSRNPDEGDLPAEVERLSGDVTAYDSIEAAFEGRDAVVNLVALSPLFKPSGGNERHFEVHLGGTENCVRAAEEHGVGHLVQMSGIHASPTADTAYLKSKGEAEEAVRQSSLDWTIFRPTVLFGEGDEIRSFTKLVATPYLTPLPGGGEQQFQLMWIEDFVPLMADAIEGETGDLGEEEGVETAEESDAGDDDDAAEAADEDETEEGGEEDEEATEVEVDEDADGDVNPHVGKIYEVGGPEVQSFAEVVRLTWAAENKPTSVVPVPMALADVGLSVLGSIGGPLGSDQAKSLRKDLIVEHNDIDAFGVDPEDLTTYAEYLGVDPAAAQPDRARA